MAWSVPRTASADEIWTSSDWNKYVRDNLNETFPGKATAALQYFVATGVNTIATRTASSATVATSEGTTSTSYTDLTTSGPAVTVTTGKAALAMYTARMANNTASTQCRIAVTVSGASSDTASDAHCALVDGVAANNTNRFGMVRLYDNLTAGSNTFTMKYKAGGGTATFQDRHIIVVPL